MDLFKAIDSRHSMRSFKEDPVPRELITKAVEAAAKAPSAMNEQSWLFYAIQGESRKVLGQIMAQGTAYLEEYMEILGHEVSDDIMRWYSELGGAPVAILCTIEHSEDNFATTNRLLSMGAAIENMLLVAADIGLGACNVTFSYWVREELAKALGIPENREIVSIIVLGYPDGAPAAPSHNLNVAEYLD